MPSSITSISPENTHTPLILDGGMGRELHRMGAPFRQPEWSALSLMERPDLVQQAHENFLKAGAQVITSNSYAVVPFHIGEERFAEQGEDLARLSGVLGRQAIESCQKDGKTPVLAGSLPPTGGSYRPDLFTPQKAEAVLTPLIRGLAPSVDLWLAETQSSIAELQTAHRLVRQNTNDTRPFWGAFTLDDADPASLVHRKAPVRLRSGELLEDAVKAALLLKLDALLFNCSDPRIMLEALRTARQTIQAHTEETTTSPMRLGVYANGFAHNHHEDEGKGANESITPLDGTLTPQHYSEFAQLWHEAGADIIGGCCGIGPEHIAALAAHFSATH